MRNQAEIPNILGTMGQGGKVVLHQTPVIHKQ